VFFVWCFGVFGFGGFGGGFGEASWETVFFYRKACVPPPSAFFAILFCFSSSSTSSSSSSNAKMHPYQCMFYGGWAILEGASLCTLRELPDSCKSPHRARTHARRGAFSIMFRLVGVVTGLNVADV
jgi:hypothetical protein